MQRCRICFSRRRNLYRIDEFLICESCLTQGRLEELPTFALAGTREQKEGGEGSTLSSWWNRRTPAGSSR